MSADSVELALGTVQFGLGYGVVGRAERVPEKEVQQILARAWELGIRVLDTAPAYGDIEEKLVSLLNGREFEIISKVPALISGMDAHTAEKFVLDAINQTRKRLGHSLKALLFHSAEDLLGEYGEIIWNVATQAILGTGIALGVSCYSPDEAFKIQKKYGIHIAQLPGNALDQRLDAFATRLKNVKKHF